MARAGSIRTRVYDRDLSRIEMHTFTNQISYRIGNYISIYI